MFFPAMRRCFLQACIYTVLLGVVYFLAGCSEETTSSKNGEVPEAVEGISVEFGNASCVVSWDAVTGATSYNVYYSTSGDLTPDNGIKEENVSSPHTITDLTNGVTYYFIVTALNSYGESVSREIESGSPNGANE